MNQHSSKFVPRFMHLPDSVVDDYKNGSTLEKLALKHHVTVAQIRQKLTYKGVEISRRKQPNHIRKLDNEAISQILELDLKNISHSSIAPIFGVSRERVRQICAAKGHQTRRERQTKMVSMTESHRASAIAKRKIIEDASELWKQGTSYEQLAVILGCVAKPHNVYYRISQLRRKHGNDLFPYRKPNHWRVKEHEVNEHPEPATADS